MTYQTSTTPKGWKMTTLGEVAEKIFSGGTPSTQRADFYDGTIPWLRTQEVNFNYIYDTDIKITEEGLNNSSAKWVPENSVIIAMYGNSAGRTAFSKIRMTTNQACCNFIADKEKSDAMFIFFNLRGRYLEIEGMANGGAQQNLSGLVLKELRLNLPPLPEQRAIAAVLSSLDNKIELLRAQNKTLEASAQAIFKEWFVNFNFPGATGKMIDSELGEIPEGWRVGKIKDLIDILSGFSFLSSEFSQDGKYKLVTIKNVQDRYFDSTTTDTLKEIPEKMPAHCKLESGDILLSLTGNIGRICLVNGEGYLLNQRVAKLKAKDSTDYAFTYLLFLQDSIFSLLQSTASGTAQQNLSPIQTKEIEIIIADRRTLDQFGRVANKLVQKINDNLSQIQILSKLRDALLPKLIKGAVRVKGFND